MGIVLIDKSADFSANAVGHLGLYTSVTSGLRGLYELRRSAAKARQNNAPDYADEAVFSNAAFNDNDIDINAAGEFTLPFGPSNGGENSFAILLRMHNGGAATDLIGSLPSGSPTTNGAVYFIHYNRTVVFESTRFNSQADGATYTGNASPSIVRPAGEDGTIQLFVGTIKSQEAAKLYHPASNSVVSVALAAGQYAYYKQGVTNRAWRGLAGSGTTVQSVGLIGAWTRAITAEEVATFYAEIRKQYALRDVAI